MTGLGVVASAQTFGTALNGASNEEIFQVKYNGAAWNYPGSGYHWASFKYSRNGQVLLTKTAYNGRVEGSVWDDLIHWGSASQLSLIGTTDNHFSLTKVSCEHFMEV